MPSEPTYIVEQCRYDIKKQKWVARQGHELVQNFKFSGRDYFVTHKGNFYFVCTNGNDGKLYSLIHLKDFEDGHKLTPGEVSSFFRKNFLKHKITEEKILTFIEMPLNA